MKPSLSRVLTGIAAVGVTVGALYFTWRSQWAADPVHEGMQRSVGARLADEVAAVVGPTGRVVVVTLDSGASAVVDRQHEAFLERLKQWPGLKVIRTDEVDASKGDKYGPGTGLSARRWQRLVEKEPDANVIVSLIGAPDPEELPKKVADAKGPRLVAVSRSPKQLAPLVDGGLLARAIVPRFTFPAPGPESPRTPAEWFENRFQVVGGR